MYFQNGIRECTKMRKRLFACATILIFCYFLSLEINTTYGEQRLTLHRPVGTEYPISQPFGPSSDKTLQEAYKKWGYEGHFGVDYACPVGTDIFACDNGEVVETNDSDPDHPNGLYVRIKHKWGSSVYLHLSSIAVLNGKSVTKNSVIGSSGKTGFVTGPHLHFGIRISGIPNPGYKDYIDPLKHASFESPITHISTSKITEQKKSPEVSKSPEYSKETLLLRRRIKLHKERINNISNRLLRSVPNAPPITFNLTASEEVNAWADGRITMGLMDFLYDNPATNPDDKLAMIMAHIVAHKKLDADTISENLKEELESSKATYNDIISGISNAVSAVVPTPPVWLASTVLGEGSKEIVNWITKKTLKTFQGDQENTSHFFSILYVNKAGFVASEGLKIFNYSTEFSRQHPIDRQFWEDYAKEVQAKLDHERQLAAGNPTDQKKLPEATKKTQQNQMVSKLERSPGKVTIEDGLIKQKGSYKIYLLLNGKKYLIQDRATLKSLNFEKQGVRALTSNVFNSIPEGNSKEAKEIFALRKEDRRLRTQEAKKLTSVDKRLFSLGGQKTDKKVQKLPRQKRTTRGNEAQKAGKEVQKLPTTMKFNIPHIYKKTAKNTDKHSAKSNFVIPDVYNTSKSYYSRNIPSSSLDSLKNAQDIFLREMSLETEEELIRLLKMPNRKKGQSYADALGSLTPRERNLLESGLTIVRSERQIMKQERKNQQYGLGYNQGIPYQTTPMTTNRYKGKSTGYAEGLDRLKSFSTSDFNIIQPTNIPINEIVLQPGPGEGKDIWTTSAYSYAPGGGGPGGGRDNEWLEMGGWGDSYHILIEFDLTDSPPRALFARVELFVGKIKGNGTTGVYVDRITEFWDWRIQGTGLDHERLWWADRPSATQWTPSPLPAPIVGQWYSIDITNLYNAWKDGTYPNYGIQLRPVSNDNRWNKFFSSDYTGDPTLRPKLVIQVP